MNRKFLIVGAGLFALLLSACGDEPASSSPPLPAVTVETLSAQRVTLTRELPGRTSAFQVAEVRPQVNGIIKQRLFTEGSLVEAGQPLYQLEDATYRAEYDSAKASLQRAEAAMKIARLNAERASELIETNAVSRQEYDTAMASLQQAEAEAALARATLNRAEVTLQYSRITSPIAGRIGRSAVTAGALVTANQPEPLAIVQQLDPIHVDVSQSAAELLELRKAMSAGTVTADDMPVTLLLADGSRYDHEGRLAFSEASVDPGTGSYLLRVVVPNPDHLLMPGMFVRANVGRGVRENAVLAPQQAVSRTPRGTTTAMVIGNDDTVEARTIEVSRAIGNRWLVESGLEAGERVVVEGLQKIQPGMKVQAVESESTSAAPASAN